MVTAAFSRAVRVEVHNSLARQTWVMEERDRLEARRWGISVSRGEGVEFTVELGSGSGEGWCRDEEVEEIMVDGEVDICRVGSAIYTYSKVDFIEQ